MFFNTIIVDTSMQIVKTEKLSGIQRIIEDYDVFFIDLWGVMHNGVECYSNAITVLKHLKNKNKKIVLISNAPRPSETVEVFLDKIKLSKSLYDKVVTSGDVTREYLQLENNSQDIFHLGPDKDKDLFKNLNVTFVDEEKCKQIICTGLFNAEKENIEDYQDLLIRLKDRNIKMICANPDEVVHRGSKLEYCAGALAKQYEDFGGVVRYFGKPYPEIYNFALNKLNILEDFEKKNISAFVIGDNLKTDIKGANLLNINSLLILNGIYKDFFRNDEVDFEKLKDSVNLKLLKINYYQDELTW